MIHFKKRITKALIRLCGCAGWSAPLLFANPGRQVFSRQGPYKKSRVCDRVATVREKSWNMKKKFQVMQKSDFNFGQRDMEKKERQGKVWEFYLKLNVSRLLNCIISKSCKQFIIRNITFLIFMLWDVSLKFKSASIDICTNFNWNVYLVSE